MAINYSKEDKSFTFRKMDSMNRISIPAKMRRQLGLEQEDYLQVKIENDTIILRPMELTERKQ